MTAANPYLTRLASDLPSWRESALCGQTDPETFFPEKGSIVSAQRVCEACPVRAECLAYALARDERFGVWGGMGENERRRLRNPDPKPRQSSTYYRNRAAEIRGHAAAGLSRQEIAARTGYTPDVVKRILRYGEAAA